MLISMQSQHLRLTAVLRVSPRLSSDTCSERETVDINPHQLSVSKIATLIHGFNARLANRPFLVFDFRALWRSGLSARVPESQKLKMVG